MVKEIKNPRPVYSMEDGVFIGWLDDHLKEIHEGINEAFRTAQDDSELVIQSHARQRYLVDTLGFLPDLSPEVVVCD